jgi:division/cell wall cluster transcriptional repressor MraZ
MSNWTKKVKSVGKPTGTEVGHGEPVQSAGGGSGGQPAGQPSGIITHFEEEEICYLGEYRHGADEKRRIQVPSRWRPENFEGYELTATVWTRNSGAQSCLMVFPPVEMKSFVRSMKSMSWGDPEAETLRRALGGKADTLTLDKAGRVCISDRLAKLVGIEKNSEVVLVGMVDVFQIWNADRWKSIDSADVVSLPQALGRLKKEQT